MPVAQPARLERHVGLSDEEVVARVQAGELALYEILMRRHNQQVYRAVRSILRQESEVEDVVQEAYFSAYRHLAKFEGRARFSTWLVRIAVNAALDRRRRRARVVALDPATEERLAAQSEPRIGGNDGGDPEEQSARRELAHLLESAIDDLPELFRVVYVLREVEGMDTQETAESLEIEPATVKTRLHRARTLLRERLIHDFDTAALQAFPFGAERCDRLVAAVLDRLARGE
ncbi:RNA polymerase sigma factor [Myxococcota bacterium]|nr:RNA polymerase sigma factor [Myxococcota bacterium]MCZ7619910.1 RNA polymerase sigma factor [Myxococcota bacterium]